MLGDVRPLDGSARILQSALRESPLISVVLPTFNRAALLPESIESVLSQTERNFELIIVDDGSSDATAEIVGRCAARDERITHISQQNLGLPRALNNGFRVARGQFFTWTSDDNRYLPDALSIMSRHLIAHPAVGLVCAQMLLRTPRGLIPYPVPASNKFWRENAFGGAFIYRRSVAEIVGEYDPSLALVEDYDFFLRVSYHTVIHQLPDVLYEYRQHGNSLTTVRQAEQLSALERLLNRHVALRKAKPWQLSRLATTISRTYRTTGQPADAIRLALLAWRLWPFNLRIYRHAVLLLLPGMFRRRVQSG